MAAQKRPLSEREAAVLALILAGVKETGVPPSNRELGRQLDCSHVAVHLVKKSLQRRKLIKTQPRVARGVTVNACGAASDLFLLFVRTALRDESQDDRVARLIRDAFSVWQQEATLATGTRPCHPRLAVPN